MELQDRHVLVTGGSRGIGPFIAAALLARGARVTISARSGDGLERVRDALGTDRVHAVPADVAEEDDRVRLLKEAEHEGGPLDVLVNNAGIESVGHFPAYDQDTIAAILRVNLDAPIQLTRLAVPGMLERRRGHIVNVASLAGKAAVPYNTVYAASKHGLVGFTYSLLAELGDRGVGASVVCPGYVTDHGLFSRWATRPEPPRGSGTGTTPAAVARAVVTAIERERPDVVVSGALPKIADVALAVSPRVSIAASRRTGAYELLRREAERAGRF